MRLLIGNSTIISFRHAWLKMQNFSMNRFVWLKTPKYIHICTSDGIVYII